MTAGTAASPHGLLTVLIPAHNEASTIENAVRSVAAADRVIVVADNCTDDTVAIAGNAGAEVFVTEGNTEMKAGALNQALAHLLDRLTGFVLVMDADSEIGSQFLQTAGARLAADPELGAVGGVFYGVWSAPTADPTEDPGMLDEPQEYRLRAGVFGDPGRCG
jgi:biofilm PGA synthesis N-glycosyltransferase PgaC